MHARVSRFLVDSPYLATERRIITGYQSILACATSGVTHTTTPPQDQGQRLCARLPLEMMACGLPHHALPALAPLLT